MPRKILVPLDCSPLAERALPYAAALARSMEGELILLCGTSGVGQETDESGSPIVLSELKAVAARLAAEGVSARPEVSYLHHGDPRRVDHEPYVDEVSRLIVREASAQQVDLIVMSTHGRGGLGRWLFGSVADQVVRHADVPIMLISAACDRPWPADRPPRILVPLDDSELAREGLQAATALATPLRAELELLEVVDGGRYPVLFTDPSLWKDPEPELSRVEQRLDAIAAAPRQAGLAVTVSATLGAPAAAIARFAQDHDIDLIAMATHGRGGLARVALGSVATEVLHRANTPLLLVRPAAIRRTAEPTRESAAHV